MYYAGDDENPENLLNITIISSLEMDGGDIHTTIVVAILPLLIIIV